ncbi:hypothetical protein ACTHP2_00510 [Bacillus altitudinis]|uniref:hypothetical protein n=1 Tax=Bacillus altitudinis TaxID=293387 RepID=UPI003F7C1181
MNLPEKIFKSDLFLIIMSILKIISIASLLLTGGGLFIYSIGYAFLYGYYFSGELEQTNTWIEIVTVIVPFPGYTVLIISSLVILSSFYILHIIKLLKTKKMKHFFLFVLLWLLLNTLLTIIFTGEITIENLIYLSLFWTVPVFLAMLVVALIKMAKDELSISLLSPVIYGIIINMFIYYIFKEEFIILTSFFLIFVFTSRIFSNHRFLIRFIKILPFTILTIYIILVIGDSLNIPFPYKTKFLISVLTVIILTCYYSKLYPKFWPKGEIANNKDYKQGKDEKFKITEFIRLINKKEPALLIPILIIFLLILVVYTPIISKETGKLMRTVTPDTSLKFEQIHSSYSKEPTEGILVIENNEILYISTREAQLIRIKDEKYKTEPLQ